MSGNDEALETLNEVIQHQARLIAELQSELHGARQASVETMLGQLRLRGAVLLYVGQDAQHFTRQIIESFGGGIAGAVSKSLFILDNAPLPSETKETFRKAAHHGMNRW